MKKAQKKKKRDSNWPVKMHLVVGDNLLRLLNLFLHSTLILLPPGFHFRASSASAANSNSAATLIQSFIKLIIL